MANYLQELGYEHINELEEQVYINNGVGNIKGGKWNLLTAGQYQSKKEIDREYNKNYWLNNVQNDNNATRKLAMQMTDYYGKIIPTLEDYTEFVEKETGLGNLWYNTVYRNSVYNLLPPEMREKNWEDLSLNEKLKLTWMDFSYKRGAKAFGYGALASLGVFGNAMSGIADMHVYALKALNGGEDGNKAINAQIDKLKDLSDNWRKAIKQWQETLREESGIGEDDLAWLWSVGLGQVVGNIAPSMALGKIVGSGGTALAFGLSAFADTYNRQLEADVDDNEAFARGIAHFLTEAGGELLEASILLKTRVAKSIGLTALLSAVENAGQESAQQVGELAANWNIDDRPFAEKLNEVLVSGVFGFLVGGVGSVAGEFSITQKGRMEALKERLAEARAMGEDLYKKNPVKAQKAINLVNALEKSLTDKEIAKEASKLSTDGLVNLAETITDDANKQEAINTAKTNIVQMMEDSLQNNAPVKVTWTKKDEELAPESYEIDGVKITHEQYPNLYNMIYTLDMQNRNENEGEQSYKQGEKYDNNKKETPEQKEANDKKSGGWRPWGNKSGLKDFHNLRGLLDHIKVRIGKEGKAQIASSILEVQKSAYIALRGIGMNDKDAKFLSSYLASMNYSLSRKAGVAPAAFWEAHAPKIFNMKNDSFFTELDKSKLIEKKKRKKKQKEKRQAKKRADKVKKENNLFDFMLSEEEVRAEEKKREELRKLKEKLRADIEEENRRRNEAKEQEKKRKEESDNLLDKDYSNVENKQEIIKLKSKIDILEKQLNSSKENSGDEKYKVVEIPVDEIKLSKDVPNFKEEADKTTGVVKGQELKAAKYERLGNAPIVVWERLNGDYEVITGRHRLDLARRTGEKTIPAQIVREKDGFTKEKAIVFDAMQNIADEKGSFRDYYMFFKSGIASEKDIKKMGLLSRAKGKSAYDFAKNGTKYLEEAWRNGLVNDEQAVAIARGAPNNTDYQRFGVAKKAGRTAEELYTLVSIAYADRNNVKSDSEQLGLFGNMDNGVFKQYDDLSKLINARKQEIKRVISVLKNRLGHELEGNKEGITTEKTREELKKRKEELESELYALDNIGAHPKLLKEYYKKLDTLQQVRGQLTLKDVIDKLKPQADSRQLDSDEIYRQEGDIYAGGAVDNEYIKGEYNFVENAITFFEHADLSTMVHESMHYYIKQLVDLAKQGNREAIIALDFLNKAFGKNGFGVDNRDDNERLAYSAEVYFQEGVAPNSYLQRFFDRFREWLTHLYANLKNLVKYRGKTIKLNDDLRTFFADALGGKDIDDILNARESYLEQIEAIENAIKEQEEFIQKNKEEKFEEAIEKINNLEAESIFEEPKTFIGKAKKLYKELKKDYRDIIKQGYDYTIKSISVAAEQAGGKKFKLFIRKLMYEQKRRTNAYLDRVEPFLKYLKELKETNKKRYIEMMFRLYNQDYEGVKKMLRRVDNERNEEYAKNNRSGNGKDLITNEQAKQEDNKISHLEDYFDEVTKVLEEIRFEAQRAGTNVNFLVGYFPRRIKDLEGLKRELGRLDLNLYGLMHQELGDEGMKDNTLVAEWLNRYFSNRHYVNKNIPRNTTNLKERSIRFLPVELLGFYEEPGISLQRYIEGMVRVTISGEVLGRHNKDGYNIDFNSKTGEIEVQNLEDSIGAFLAKYRDKIPAENIDNMKKILRSLLEYHQPMNVTLNKILKRSKAVAACLFIYKWSVALSQFGDFGTSIYMNKLSNAFAGYLNRAYGGRMVTLEDLQIREALEELKDQDTLGSWLDKISLFSWADRFNKESYINGRILWLQGLSYEEKLNYLTEEKGFEYEEAKELIPAIENNDTSNSNYMILLFSELSDIQPISLAELPRGYVDNPNGRIFYMFKTFQIKRLNFVINEMANAYDKGKWKEVGKTLAFLILCLGSSSAIINILRRMANGREIDFTDEITDSVLDLISLNRYLLWSAETQGFKGIASSFIPPMFPIESSILQLILSFESDRKTKSVINDMVGLIPIFGGFLKQKKKNKKG